MRYIYNNTSQRRVQAAFDALALPAHMCGLAGGCHVFFVSALLGIKIRNAWCVAKGRVGAGEFKREPVEVTSRVTMISHMHAKSIR